MEIFDRIKTLVKERGTTIEDVLQASGNISLNTYNGWKKRKVTPRLDDAYKIATALNISMEYLLTGKDKYLPFDNRTYRVATAFSLLSEEKKEIIELALGLPLYEKESDGYQIKKSV